MSTFPSSLDNLPESHADGTGEVIHASTINNLASAVNAVESAAQPVVNGASANVTAANLNALTGGGATSLHSHAGGGPSSGIQYRDVQLNNDQILALPTTPVELVPAPGVGSALYVPAIYGFGGWHLLLDWYADYGNVATGGAHATFSLLIGGGDGGQADYGGSSGVASFLAWGEGGVSNPLWAPTTPSSASGQSAILRSDAENTPLLLRSFNSTLGNFTGGDPANTLSVRVWYSVVPVLPFGA